MSAALVTHHVNAKNTSLLSDNKIHDDAVARTYGFRGGLVPGVDVYAYMTHAPAAHWGRTWLERGTITARFLHPVYDGENVDVVARETDQRDTIALTIVGGDGSERATGVASLPGEPIAAPSLDDVPVAPAARQPVAVSEEALAPGTVLGSLHFGVDTDRAATYLDDVRETLPIYANDRIAHPGWLLRWANWVLTASVRLGPWIHVASSTTHHSIAGDGDQLCVRAMVADRFERRGHRFVDLDVLIVADDVRPVVSVRHTAIYEPRRER